MSPIPRKPVVCPGSLSASLSALSALSASPLTSLVAAPAHCALGCEDVTGTSYCSPRGHGNIGWAPFVALQRASVCRKFGWAPHVLPKPSACVGSHLLGFLVMYQTWPSNISRLSFQPITFLHVLSRGGIKILGLDLLAIESLETSLNIGILDLEGLIRMTQFECVPYRISTAVQYMYLCFIPLTKLLHMSSLNFILILFSFSTQSCTLLSITCSSQTIINIDGCQYAPRFSSSSRAGSLKEQEHNDPVCSTSFDHQTRALVSNRSQRDRSSHVQSPTRVVARSPSLFLSGSQGSKQARNPPTTDGVLDIRNAPYLFTCSPPLTPQEMYTYHAVITKSVHCAGLSLSKHWGVRFPPGFAWQLQWHIASITCIIRISACQGCE